VAVVRQAVAMGFRDLLDDAVRAEEAELARDAGGRGAGVLGPWRAGGGGEGRGCESRRSQTRRG